MELTLIRASEQDAALIWQMQLEAFHDLLTKYQDTDTNPGSESIDKVLMRLRQPFTYYYLLQSAEQTVGAIRVVDKQEGGKRKRISPLFILPTHRGKGFAQAAITAVEELHGDTGWELDTILQEPGNCHLYEKMGYRATGETRSINEHLTLVFYVK
ncbi:MAG: GNAT family N-acetyltransferase [Clostridia bacterium]|nr:GNAT family N-acetyltransferase [Clostridia bacterium]